MVGLAVKTVEEVEIEGESRFFGRWVIIRHTKDGEEEAVYEEEEEDEDEDDGAEEDEEGEGKGGKEAMEKVQYLIKWPGWPETANTWEPLENLQSIADEGSLRAGKHGRKPKRKYGGPHSLMKKKQQHLSTSHDDATAEKSESSTSLNNSSLPDIYGPVDLSSSSILKGDGEAKDAYASFQVEANSGSVGMVRQVSLIEEEKEYDPTLNELMGPVDNINSRGCSEGGGLGSEGENVRPNGLLKVYPKELDKNSRFIGAKRKKSGFVKRFKQDVSTSNNHTATTDPNLTQDMTALDSFGRTTRIGNEYPGGFENNNLSEKTKAQELDILKILKPMDFTASVSDNVQEVLVTFLALSADGKEVMVDNKCLKAHNPFLTVIKKRWLFLVLSQRDLS